LLLTELVDNIALILSVGGKILYCGNAVTELLGWRDVELVDVDFVNLVDSMDQHRFLTAFNESLNASAEFNILVRLRHKDSPTSYGGPQPKYVLFDLKCYPHVDGAFETRCFFGMAAPYPSRNVAMLDTILDLKAENIRLQHMIAEHRARLPRDAYPKAQSSSQITSSEGSIYATSSLQAPGLFTSGVQRGEASGAYFPSSATLGPDGINNSGDFSHFTYGSESVLEQPAEEGSKKKKLKRVHNHLEQHVCVTCGRTESPEWRKGPSGPKTLCNACGLRWAKQMRKTDEPIEPGVGQE